MLCSKCHCNEASVYYKQNINGEIREFALCPECAENMGIGLSTPFSKINLFGTSYINKASKERKRCNLCGSSFEDIRRIGKVGCGKCYETFNEELKPMIANIHNGASHVARDRNINSHIGEIEKLKRALNEAVIKEEYEKAAELRDKIKELGES